MVVYPKAADLQKAVFIGTWGDSKIPIYDVPSMHSLNQLVGYVKHINSGNGTVLYRGQCKLYPHVIPSIKHDIGNKTSNDRKLRTAIASAIKDDAFRKFLGLRNSNVNGWEIYQKIIIEAVFQHYGAKTYCVDFVDNHWTALWFGLYHWDEVEKTYYLRNNGMQGEKDKEYVKESDFVKTINAPKKPKKTEISLDDSKIEELRECAEKGDIPFDVLVERCIATKYKRILATWERQCENIKAKNDYIIHMQNTDHLFLFLFVADTNVPQVNGLYIAENSYTVDLRKALPSNFLRPCAQHGWIVRGKENSYDFDERIACVVRMDIDLAKKMLGNGELISMENFFPNEKIDQGYKILLARQEGSRINTKYDKILPDGIIADLKQ